MPWANYAGATDEDLRAVYAYLRSLKPIKNVVPPSKVTPEAVGKISDAYVQMEKAAASSRR
jgi:hypothetical protein